MNEKKKPEWDDPEESARFIETAERIQDEHAEERFEETMKKIASAKNIATRTNKKTQ
ncbi:MAG: hypothetical protein ACLQPD_27180 [Desulfomonilaceae bacterium]